MTDQDPFQNPWFCDAANVASSAGSPEAAAAIRQLLELGQAQASLARLLTSAWQGQALPGAEQWRREFAAHYRQSFGPALAVTGMPPTAQATLRYQSALQRQGTLLAGIAQAAASRFTAALAADAGPPITSLRELQNIWIDCGERAFGEAAHGEDFASAQAELLAAWVEWKAAQAGAGGEGAR